MGRFSSSKVRQAMRWASSLLIRIDDHLVLPVLAVDAPPQLRVARRIDHPPTALWFWWALATARSRTRWSATPFTERLPVGGALVDDTRMAAFRARLTFRWIAVPGLDVAVVALRALGSLLRDRFRHFTDRSAIRADFPLASIVVRIHVRTSGFGLLKGEVNY